MPELVPLRAETATSKPRRRKLNIKYMEQWINDTLVECEDLSIPGTVTKSDHRLPLSKYGIDRNSLTVLPFISSV